MTTPAQAEQYDAIARELRARVVQMSCESKAPHLGSSLSCIDILVAAYWGVFSIDPTQPDAVERDRVILSKGHAAAALYATLAKRGFFPETWLNTFAADGSRLPEQPAPPGRDSVPGIEAATGSLGHGLSIGIGMALAGRINQRSYRVGVILSDGECNEGSVWEAAMFAASQKLHQLVAVVDFNKWQATGRSEDVMHLSPMVDKWRAFGWHTHEVDGHDIEALIHAMNDTHADKPTCVIAHTVKGKGVSFMEDDNNWHYRIPTDLELRDAQIELGVA